MLYWRLPCLDLCALAEVKRIVLRTCEHAHIADLYVLVGNYAGNFALCTNVSVLHKDTVLDNCALADLDAAEENTVFNCTLDDAAVTDKGVLYLCTDAELCRRIISNLCVDRTVCDKELVCCFLLLLNF